jgi:hypothetical protein
MRETESKTQDKRNQSPPNMTELHQQALCLPTQQWLTADSWTEYLQINRCQRRHISQYTRHTSPSNHIYAIVSDCGFFRCQETRCQLSQNVEQKHSKWHLAQFVLPAQILSISDRQRCVHSFVCVINSDSHYSYSYLMTHCAVIKCLCVL